MIKEGFFRRNIWILLLLWDCMVFFIKMSLLKNWSWCWWCKVFRLFGYKIVLICWNLLSIIFEFVVWFLIGMSIVLIYVVILISLMNIFCFMFLLIFIWWWMLVCRICGWCFGFLNMCWGRWKILLFVCVSILMNILIILYCCLWKFCLFMLKSGSMFFVCWVIWVVLYIKKVWLVVCFMIFLVGIFLRLMFLFWLLSLVCCLIILGYIWKWKSILCGFLVWNRVILLLMEYWCWIKLWVCMLCYLVVCCWLIVIVINCWCICWWWMM